METRATKVMPQPSFRGGKRWPLQVRVWCGILLSPALILLLYAGAYLGVLALPASVRAPAFLVQQEAFDTRYVATDGEWHWYPDYHGLPGWFFTPIHEWDRRYLRPASWDGHYPRNEELSFDWLLGQASTATESGQR